MSFVHWKLILVRIQNEVSLIISSLQNIFKLLKVPIQNNTNYKNVSLSVWYTLNSKTQFFFVKMSRSANPLRISPTDPMRELFEACKGGDIQRIRALVDATNVNAKDTAGRRSSPLHFAAGKVTVKFYFSLATFWANINCAFIKCRTFKLILNKLNDSDNTRDLNNRLVQYS